jgi:RNA polymerase sigma factor (sigma-70 family)
MAGGVALRDDSELIQSCIRGDDGAWKELVDRYARLVYSIPIRYRLYGADADDVFQNVFGIVFRQLGKLRHQTAFAAWLITITHRESLRVLRLTRSHEDLEDTISDSSTPPTDRLEQWERQHYVHEALKRTEQPCRDLLTALFLESPTPSYDKIAARLGMPVGSIGPTRARCFRKFESLLVSMGFDKSF